MKELAILVLAGALSACASDRYVGSIGKDHIYGNRGFGFTVRLAQEQIDERWLIVDPRSPETAPKGFEPKVFDAPLDLDGDGELVIGETTRFNQPMLRLVSRTSSATMLDAEVEILGGKRKLLPIEALAEQLAAELSGAAGGPALELKPSKVGPDFEARTATLIVPSGAVRFTVVDQPSFLGEEKQTRRQLVKVILRTPKMTDALIADHLRFLDAILLNRQGAPTTRTETW